MDTLMLIEHIKKMFPSDKPVADKILFLESLRINEISDVVTKLLRRSGEGVHNSLLDAVDYSQFGLDEKKKQILFSARLHHQKGIITLIEALNTIQNLNVQLLISGKGELEGYVKQ